MCLQMLFNRKHHIKSPKVQMKVNRVNMQLKVVTVVTVAKKKNAIMLSQKLDSNMVMCVNSIN